MGLKKIILFSWCLFFLSISHAKGQRIDTSKINQHKLLFDFEYKRPIFKLEDEQSSNLNRWLRFSVLTGYREGLKPIKGGANFDAYKNGENGTTRAYMINLSIQDMLTLGNYKSNRVILDVKDASKYRYDPVYGPEIEWLKKNGHCFEMLMPSAIFKGVKTLVEELSDVFNVKTGKEKRLVQTLVLVRLSNNDKIMSKRKGTSGYDGHGNFNNVPLSYLSIPMDSVGLPPFVDETGYKEMIDLNLKLSDWKDISKLRKELRRYDLDIKEEKRELMMFVITEDAR